jgi:NAD(P)-dependent dehydrogenase (short-subunit alcohol dehydrogenase family)
VNRGDDVPSNRDAAKNNLCAFVPLYSSKVRATPKRPQPVDSHPMTDAFSLEGRVAIVTGGSRGIGYAIARAFLEQGARVIITARSEAPLREAASTLGINAIAMPCDNADPAAITRMAEAAWQVAPIDILVNNAGISPYYRRVEHVSVEEWDQVVDVNLRGTYFASVEVGKRMMEAGLPGSIINVTSVGGIAPLERLGVYGATKAGIHQFTKVMALEWADRNIRVNAIAPGWTETDFTGELFASRHGETLRSDIPMGRLAESDDIAGAAVYLASEASRYVTGTVMVVDGGRSLR